MQKYLLAILTILYFSPVYPADTVHGVKLISYSADHPSVNLRGQTESIVMLFSRPGFDESDKAVNEKKTILRGRIRVDEKTTVSFFEHPMDPVDFIDSTIVISRRGNPEKTYYVGRKLNFQRLALAYVGYIRLSDGTVLLICNYTGGFTIEQMQGFVILRVASSGVVVSPLPLANSGKVVISKRNSRYAKVWSAIDEDLGAQSEPRFYTTQSCRLVGEEYRCRHPKREPKKYAPGDITDPGIEIRP